MQKIFLAVIDMSIVSSLVILAVLLVRALLKRAPRRFAYVLWAAVLLRLLCPFAVESPLSLIPESAGEIAQSAALSESENVTFVSAASAAYRAIGNTANGGQDFVRVEVSAPAPAVSDVQGAEYEAGRETGRQYVSASHGQVWLLLCAWLWPAGTAAVLIWGVAGQIRLRRMLVGAVRLEGEVWLADHISTAFVMGLVRPKIYLPSNLEGPGRDYVLAHERAHVRRGDHITRLLAFAALALHWFNPLVWLAFAMSGRDMEMSCDEAVMRRSGDDIRADYCQTLLDMSANKHFPSPCLLAFGEGDTGARVRNALRWKKPAFWAVCGAGVLIAAACVLLLTNQARKGENTVEISFPEYRYGNSPFKVSMALPKGWTTMPEAEVEALGFRVKEEALYARVYIMDETGTYAGYIGWHDFDPESGEGTGETPEVYRMAVYSALISANPPWEGFEVVRATDSTETCLASVHRRITDAEGENGATDIPERVFPGFCSYDKRYGVYVAASFRIGAATDKEILAMAESIALSGAEQGPADAAGSQTVKLSFPGHYVEGTKVWETGPFTATVTLPEDWTVSDGWSLIPEGTNGEGYSPVYFTDPEGVTVGKITYRIFDPDNPTQVYRAGSWSDQEYARIRYCNELYRNSSWQDYESVAYSDTAETFKATVIRSVQVNDGTAKGYHFETETRYGIGRYDTELGVYVTLELRASRVSERDAELIAKSLALEPVSLSSSATLAFMGWDYSEGKRLGSGDFVATTKLPEGWSAQVVGSAESLPETHRLCGPVYAIYDENGSEVAFAAWGGFDPEACADETVDHGTGAAVNMQLAARTDWAQRGWNQYNSNSYGGTAYIDEIIDGSGVNNGRRAVCAYNGKVGAFVIIEFADGQTYDWAARLIAQSIYLQSVGMKSDGKRVLFAPGYYYEDGLLVECRPFTARLTLPEGWTVTDGAERDEYVDTLGLLPMAYMYDAGGNYAGFIARQDLTRPIQANHYEWENIAQVASGDTDVYTADVIYDEYDESLLPGHPWRSFEAKGIRAESQDAGVYVVAQFVPEAVSGEDFGDMARSIELAPETQKYVDGFGGVLWGTDGRVVSGDLDSEFFGKGELSKSWSFRGRDCVAYYYFNHDGLLYGGRYSFDDAKTLTRQEKIELYKQLLAELEGMYGEAETTLYLEDMTPMDIQSVIDGKSDGCLDHWTKQDPYGRTLGILLEFSEHDIVVHYSQSHES